MGYIRVIGVIMGYIGIMEKKMETTIMGHIGVSRDLCRNILYNPLHNPPSLDCS